jgi:hypothetical protein
VGETIRRHELVVDETGPTLQFATVTASAVSRRA